MSNLNIYIPAISGERRQNAALTVGLPRATAGQYGRLWENFFTLLGCSVVKTPATNRRILELGDRAADGCLPVKAMLGHLLYLVGRADLIFMPHFKGGCSHMEELYTRIRENNPRIITQDGGGDLDAMLELVAGRLHLGGSAVRSAYLRASANRRAYQMEAADTGASARAVSLLGMPYVTGDSYLNRNIVTKLRERGYESLLPPLPETPRSTGLAGNDPDDRVKGLIYLAAGCDEEKSDISRSRQYAKIRSLPFAVLPADGEERVFDTRLQDFLNVLR